MTKHNDISTVSLGTTTERELAQVTIAGSLRVKAVPSRDGARQLLLSVVYVVSLVTITLLQTSSRRRESLGKGRQFLVILLLLLLLLLWMMMLQLIMMWLIVEVHGCRCLGQEVAEGGVRGQRGHGRSVLVQARLVPVVT